MSLWNRIRLLFKIKTSAALDSVEDPRQVLDYTYQAQKELLTKVRQGLVEVATSKHQLDRQVRKQRARIPQLEEQARRALALEREDLARIALQRKHTAIAELESLESQLADVAEEERRLTVNEHQLSNRIEDFRTRSEIASARYTAAEAQVRINEALSGVSGELGDLSMALGRAEEKTKRMLARASALDTLIETGTLDLVPEDGDVVERELRLLTTANAVEQELESLKAELTPESEESKA